MISIAALIPQITAAEAETLWSSPRFFAAIFAGLVIAIAFQLLLTNLSVALGATAAAGIDEGDTKDTDDSSSRDRAADAPGRIAGKVRKANHAFGIWATLTACIALFFGVWLGTELSLTVDATAGAVIGLVVWGLFYLLTMWIESSIVGSLLRAAGQGIRGASQGVGSLFRSSETKQVAETAAQVTAAVRDELLQDKRVRDLGKGIRATIERLESTFDPSELRSELETLIDRTKVEASVGDGREGRTNVQASLKTKRGPSRSKLQRVGAAASRVQAIFNEEADSDKGAADSTADAGMRLAGVSPEAAAEYRERFEDYLRRTESEALEPEGLKRDLETLFDDPRRGWAALKERFSGVNRDTVKSLLTARGVEDERAEKIVGWAESALQSMSGSFRSGNGDLGHGDIGDWDTDNEDTGNGGTGNGDNGGGARGKLRSYLAQVDDPALRYEDLRDELELLFDDPRAGADALITRLKSLDRDSIKSLLAARSSSDEQQAERTIQAIEEARDKVVARAQQAKQEVERRLLQAKQKTLEVAEETRRTVSTAAWWAFGAAAASGVAAVLGGIVAVSTGIGG